MKKRNFKDNFRNAAGTIFLFAAAFFVFSTFLSIRAVFAEVAPVQLQQATTSSPRSVRAGKVVNVRDGSARTSNVTVARGATANSTASRGSAPKTATRSVAARSTASRGSAPTTTARNVAARSTVSRGSAAKTAARNVSSRVAVKNAGAVAARVSLTGTAIRGSNSTSYTYLSNKLYTGTYSNIIDSTTGLISDEAYNKCKEAYYSCMDEICTARNSAQRRCACAGRVKSFSAAEEALNTANEELIKVSGELALLIATKGKDVSAAFELTDAEKVMNCVSYSEMVEEYKSDTDADDDGTDDKQTWCYTHGFYDDSCARPDYCDSANNSFGFDIDDLDNGSGSDILASLQAWADAKDATLTITTNNNDNLSNALSTINDVVGDMSGLTSTLTQDEDLTDSLAETWGYELFEYAHNNVCNRVLDSCFNGIFESCGVPGDTGRDCSGNKSTCPYNYNTYITVNNTGSYELEFVTGSNGTSSSSATCYGYTSTTDPYEDLRGPIADSRRSILQKYALDANADCDAYGEELKDQAQTIAYQKAAAQQALQQKRLEFYQDEEDAKTTEITEATENYTKCLSEIQDCRSDYDSYRDSKGWTYNRIKSYCSTISNVPSCYETMVCEQDADEVITSDDVADDDTLVQNVVTLSDVLSLTDDTARSACLALDVSVDEIRGYGTTDNSTESCTPLNGTIGYKTWDSTDSIWSDCQATACNTGYHVETNTAGNRVCVLPDNAHADATATVVDELFVPVVGARCNSGYIVSNDDDCVSAACPTESLYDTSCTTVAANNVVGGCAKIACKCLADTETYNGACID